MSGVCFRYVWSDFQHADFDRANKVCLVAVIERAHVIVTNVNIMCISHVKRQLLKSTCFCIESQVVLNFQRGRNMHAGD